MAIVLNESEWAEEMISSRSLGKKPFETMRRVARYYLDNGIAKRDVRKILDTFLLQCDPSASLPKWQQSLDAALAAALRYPAVNLDGVDITKPEMERIDALEGKQVRRLAFTLLCLAKYWNAVSGKTEGWVNSRDADIMRMANINTSIKRQSLMYHNLNSAGLVQFSRKVDNTNVRVCFITPGEIVLRVTDFRNLGYQYMRYHGAPYFVCENCGITVPYNHPKTGRKQKYCSSCSAEIIIQRHVGAAMSPDRNRKRGERKVYTVYMHEFPNGKVYIGSTTQTLSRRWRSGAGYSGSAVGNAIDEFGWENVKHYVLFEGTDRDSAMAVESYMIVKTKSYLEEHGYNIREKTGCSDGRDEIVPAYTMREVDGDGRTAA